MDPRDTLSALKIERQEATTPRPGRWGWLLVALIALAAGSALAWWCMRPSVVAVHTVTADAAGEADGATALNASGYVVAQQQAAVASQVTGMVTVVYVREGDRVKAGQILALLDDSAASASVASAKAQLAADQDLVPQYRAQARRDRLTLARDRKLIVLSAIARSSLDDARAALAVDEAQLAHALGLVAVDQKNLSLKQTLLSYDTIRAPFAGVVTERYAHPGEMISPQAVGGFTQTGICKVVDMKSLEIDVDVNEAYIQRVHAGQNVEAVLDAYPDWTIRAHVISVVPTANEQKATVKVRIAFDRLDPRILPQMGVSVRFLDGQGPLPVSVKGIQVPVAAVKGPVGARYVFVVEHGRAVRRPVVVRSAGRSTLRVVRGLDGGEQVVVSATAPLRNGEEVHQS